MSKYLKLWEYIKEQSSDTLKLTYEEIETIAGVPLEHSFLTYKKGTSGIRLAGKKNSHEREVCGVYKKLKTFLDSPLRS